ncbi:MAG TPA: hypothetical protein VG819_10170 [Rhizomicrobium sp.]|jgi:hypothetical protein|nr:hypothetical protein [Rhizomicrobium sp.]
MTLTDHLQPLLDKRLPATIVAGMLFVASARAENHLVPEVSSYMPLATFQSGYMTLDMKVFAEAFSDDVKARVVVEPSFSHEFAVGVREAAGKYYLIYFEAPEQIWKYVVLEEMKKGDVTVTQGGKSTTADEIAKLEKSLPPDVATIKLDKHELEIGRDLAEALLEDWRELLLQTHYDRDVDFGLDGDFYHFSMTVDRQDLAGRVWSPPRDTDIGRLVEIVYAIRDICSGKKGTSLNDIRSQALDLNSRLQTGATGVKK